MRVTARVLAWLLLLVPSLGSQAVVGVEEVEEPPRYQNTLKWSTASEVDNFGYDVYRGDSDEGPFGKLTKEPIPGAGTTDEPSHYEYVDDTIDPRRVYYYYVESIAMDGTRERFTPVRKAEAKLPPGDDGGP